MCFRYIVEGEDAVAELEQKECAERDNGPERELHAVSADRACGGLQRLCIPLGSLRSALSRVGEQGRAGRSCKAALDVSGRSSLRESAGAYRCQKEGE